MENFTQIDPAQIDTNFIRAIAQEWMLVTAGNEQQCNTMTASWGFAGEMWGHHAVQIVLRPGRYTKELVDRQERFTLAFFDEAYRPALNYCGSQSGRDGDKFVASGLTLTRTDAGVPVPAQARLVLECTKLYVDEFREANFLRPELVEKWYPKRDFHTFYIARIEKAYVK